jgi:hypothetical protein
MDNRSSVDMSITLKDTKNNMHIRRKFHFVKQGIYYEFDTLVWIRKHSMVTDGMAKVLDKKYLMHKIQCMITIIDRN